jgi:hypothetical protein
MAAVICEAQKVCSVQKTILTDTDKEGNTIFSRPDIQRYRQWYLPDIDLSRIKQKKRASTFALNILNI